MKQRSWLSGLDGGAQSQRLRLGAHLGLGEAAHRETDAGELGLAEHVEHVRLVLGRVGGGAQRPAVSPPLHPGVMAGGEQLASERLGAVEERREPDGAVALDARVGRLPAGVPIGERLDDGGAEPLHVVEHVVGDVELGCDPAGVLGVADGAAAGGGHLARRPFPLLEGHPDDLVPCLHEQGGCHRRVDPARHGHQHLHRSAPITAATSSAAAGPSAGRSGQPKLKRTHSAASAPAMPIACKTWDDRTAPEEQAEPADAATPASSSRTSSVSAATPGIRTWADLGDAVLAGDGDDHVGHQLCQPPLEAVAGATHLDDEALPVGGGGLHGGSHPHDPGDVRCPRAETELLATAVNHRLQVDTPRDDEQPDPFGASQLVPGERDEVGAGLGDGHRVGAEGLHGIGVDQRPGHRRLDRLGDLAHRLPGPGLVVGGHHRHHRGSVADRFQHVVGGHDPGRPDRHHHRLARPSGPRSGRRPAPLRARPR